MREAFIRQGVERAVHNMAPKIVDALVTRVGIAMGLDDEAGDDFRAISRLAHDMARDLLEAILIEGVGKGAESVPLTENAQISMFGGE